MSEEIIEAEVVPVKKTRKPKSTVYRLSDLAGKVVEVAHRYDQAEKFEAIFRSVDMPSGFFGLEIEGRVVFFAPHTIEAIAEKRITND